MSDKNSKEMNQEVKTQESTEKVGATTNAPTKTVPAVLTKEDIAKLDYSDFSTPARLLALSEVLVKSKLCPLKSKEDAFVAIQTGKELGLPFVVSVSQIYPIEGKPTLGVHIIRGILLREGIFFNKTHDCEDYFAFAATKDGVIQKENDKPIIVKKGFLDEQPENTLKSKIDVRTQYIFERDIKSPSGKWRTITVKSSFGVTDVNMAELGEKTNYKRHLPRMLDARAFAIGSREIADDILNGIYTPTEMIDGFNIEDIDYTIDEEGVETIIINDQNK